MTNRQNKERPEEVFNEIYKLNIKIRKLESAIEGFLGNGRNVSNDVLSKCLIEFKEFGKLKAVDGNKLKCRVFEIKMKVKKLRQSIENIDPSDEYVAGVKTEMEGIEALISELKHEQKDSYELLLRCEISLWQECVFMEKKICSWELGEHENDPFQPGKVAKTSEVMSQNVILNQPVIALQKFLDDNGGKTGRWSTIDHQTFLRIRIRYTKISQKEEVSYPRDEETFFRDLASLLAPKSLVEIEAHEIWYQRYQELLLEKKKFINKWKEEKMKQETKEVEIEVEEASKTSGKSDWEKEKKRLEKQRQELDTWRADKALEEYRMKAEKEKLTKEELERRRRDDEIQRTEIRRQVDSYKHKRMEMEAEKSEFQLKLKECEQEEKKRELEQHSARISERNTRMVEDRILKKHQKQNDEEMRQERLNQIRNKVAVCAPRDPSRLLKPTTGWIQRLADVDSTPSNISATTRISNVQHRTVPLWRRDTP